MTSDRRLTGFFYPPTILGRNARMRDDPAGLSGCVESPGRLPMRFGMEPSDRRHLTWRCALIRTILFIGPRYAVR